MPQEIRPSSSDTFDLDWRAGPSFIPDHLPPPTNVDPIVYEEYCHRVYTYIHGLDGGSTSVQQENTIVSLLARMEFFNAIEDAIRGTSALRVNSRYDANNITQRFLLLYLAVQLPIFNIAQLIENRPLPGYYTNVPTRPFNSGDLNFLEVDSNEVSARPQEEAYDPGQAEMFDFTVNGQKLKLSLFATPERNLRTSYIARVTLRVTSDRGTNVRHIAHFESLGRRLAFRRLHLNRPAHGFKFVRPIGDGAALVVKEIH